MHSSSYPLISVVMSVYNGEEHLAEAIDSILSQSYSNFEFIIVNDGSTDSSIDIINEYKNKDNRIVVIDRQNKGLPYSLNEGISRAKGEYIARMDADDISFLDRIEKQIHYMIQKNLDVCGSSIEVFGKNINNYIVKYPINHDDIIFRLMFSSALAHPTVIFRKDVFDKVRYNPDYRVAQDYQLWMDIINMDFKIGNLPDVLMKYRIHDAQASVDKIKLQQDTTKQIRVNYSKTLSQEECSIISRSISIKNNVNLKQFNLLIKDIQKLGKSKCISEDTIFDIIKEIYNCSSPKTPLLYLVYRKRCKIYETNLAEELKLFAKSLIRVDSNTELYKTLKKLYIKLNL